MALPLPLPLQLLVSRRCSCLFSDVILTLERSEGEGSLYWFLPLSLPLRFFLSFPLGIFFFLLPQPQQLHPQRRICRTRKRYFHVTPRKIHHLRQVSQADKEATLPLRPRRARPSPPPSPPHVLRLRNLLWQPAHPHASRPRRLGPRQ